MRTRTVNYWISQIISAEKENTRNKEPQGDEDLLNYQLAEYFIAKSEDTNQSKVA